MHFSNLLSCSVVLSSLLGLAVLLFLVASEVMWIQHSIFVVLHYPVKHAHLSHPLANEQGGLLVAEVGHITHDLLPCRTQRSLEVLYAVEVEERLDRVRARIHGLVRLRDPLDLADRVALEAVRAKCLGNHGHVRLEVVVHVEVCIGSVGVQDGDLNAGHVGRSDMVLWRRVS